MATLVKELESHLQYVETASKDFYASQHQTHVSFPFSSNLAITATRPQKFITKISIVGNATFNLPSHPIFTEHAAVTLYQEIVGHFLQTNKYTVHLGGVGLPMVTLKDKQNEDYIYFTYSLVDVVNADIIVFTNMFTLFGTSALATINGYLLGRQNSANKPILVDMITRDLITHPYDEQQKEFLSTLTSYTQYSPRNIFKAEAKVLELYENLRKTKSSWGLAQGIDFFDSTIMTYDLGFGHINLQVASNVKIEASTLQMTVHFFQLVISAFGTELKSKSPLGIRLSQYAKPLLHLIKSDFIHARQKDASVDPLYTLVPMLFSLKDDESRFALYCFANVLSLLCDLNPAYAIDFETKDIQNIYDPHDDSSGYRIPTELDFFLLSKDPTQYGSSLIQARHPTNNNDLKVDAICDYQANLDQETSYFDSANEPLTSQTAQHAPTWPVDISILNSHCTNENRNRYLVAGFTIPSGRLMYNTDSVNPTILTTLDTKKELSDLADRKLPISKYFVDPKQDSTSVATADSGYNLVTVKNISRRMFVSIYNEIPWGTLYLIRGSRLLG